MTISLYKAAHEVQQKIMLCVDEDGVIDTDKMDAIGATFNDRAVATVAVFKHKGHTIDTLKSYLEEVKKQIALEMKNQERLKDYLQASMTMAGADKIESDDHMLTATLYKDRDESVELDEGAEFDLALCGKPKKPEPSKTLIKAAILKGEAIAGARIVLRDRLTIK